MPRPRIVGLCPESVEVLLEDKAGGGEALRLEEGVSVGVERPRIEPEGAGADAACPVGDALHQNFANALTAGSFVDRDVMNVDRCVAELEGGLGPRQNFGQQVPHRRRPVILRDKEDGIIREACDQEVTQRTHLGRAEEVRPALGVDRLDLGRKEGQRIDVAESRRTQFDALILHPQSVAPDPSVHFGYTRMGQPRGILGGPIRCPRQESPVPSFCMTVHLRAPRPSDEANLRRLHAQLQDENFDFLLSQGNWDDVLSEFEREARGTELGPGRVRAEFLVAEVQGVPVGRVSIRYSLTDFLLEVGGHVGYAVGPAFRGRGYAKQILQLSVARLAQCGVQRVLVTCDDSNAASAAVIEHCSGRLEDVRNTEAGVLKRRYWIDATQVAREKQA